MMDNTNITENSTNNADTTDTSTQEADSGSIQPVLTPDFTIADTGFINRFKQSVKEGDVNATNN